MTVWFKSFLKGEANIIVEWGNGLITNSQGNKLDAFSMCYWAVYYNKPLVFEHCIMQCEAGSINRVFDYYCDQGLTFMHVAIKQDSYEVALKLLQLGFSKFNYAQGDLHRAGPCYSCQNSLFTNAKKKAEEENIPEQLRTRRVALYNILMAAGANNN